VFVAGRFLSKFNRTSRVLTVGEAFEQARKLAASGQLAEAEVIYRRLVELLPQAPDVWGALGVFYLEAGRPDAATGPLEKATELAPTHGPYFGALGASYRALPARLAARLQSGPPRRNSTETWRWHRSRPDAAKRRCETSIAPWRCATTIKRAISIARWRCCR
jgi:tetratricopeptide (TPR) repeat protein